MSDSRDDESTTTGRTDDTGDAKREWHPPTLTVLGDAATLTTLDLAVTDDGDGSS
jgi:hypothetical protein